MFIWYSPQLIEWLKKKVEWLYSSVFLDIIRESPEVERTKNTLRHKCKTSDL